MAKRRPKQPPIKSAAPLPPTPPTSSPAPAPPTSQAAPVPPASAELTAPPPTVTPELINKITARELIDVLGRLTLGAWIAILTPLGVLTGTAYVIGGKEDKYTHTTEMAEEKDATRKAKGDFSSCQDELRVEKAANEKKYCAPMALRKKEESLASVKRNAEKLSRHLESFQVSGQFWLQEIGLFGLDRIDTSALDDDVSAAAVENVVTDVKQLNAIEKHIQALAASNMPVYEVGKPMTQGTLNQMAIRKEAIAFDGLRQNTIVAVNGLVARIALVLADAGAP